MKRILKLMVWVMLLGLPVVMTSCDGLVTAFNDNPISPGLKVTTPSIQVEKGKTFKCNAKASSRTKLVYASADPSIATVDSYGVITGVAEGKTTITVTTEGKDSQAKSIFTIESLTIPVEVVILEVPVESVKLDKTELTVTLGDDPVKLVATVNPDNADSKTVVWTTSDEEVATVDDKGEVTFVGSGTATITATATNGTTDTADDKTAECELTVKCLVDKITLNKTSLDLMKDGDGETLTVTFNPTGATETELKWESSKPAVATVDANGKVTPVAQGSATITCTATNGTEDTGDDKTAKCEVAVWNTVDLSEKTGTGTYEAQDYDLLTGTLGGKYEITVASGATSTTIMLKDVDINGSGTWEYDNHAGLTCKGDATIILSGTNTVKGFQQHYPGITVAVDKTLTIKGDGKLTASCNGGWGAGIGAGRYTWYSCGNIEIQGGDITATGGPNGAGIGAAYNGPNEAGTCGNITISGGKITATGGNDGAGIGGGNGGACGDITITGGTIEATGDDDSAGIGGGGYSAGHCGKITISGGKITATGGTYGAGIGGGNQSYCGDITITDGVTQVTATRGANGQHSIGKGKKDNANYGTVTIGGVVGYISAVTYTYPAP